MDWYPWGEEAFEKAKAEDKPIFLSIGYSTCHWCHVMAHESFEDDEVAQVMNEAFINIKVDREERPDIDKTYMQVAHMMTGRGGWPLTIIMTPEKKPFYADTYIPKTSRYGKPGLLEMIPRISHLWENDQSNISQVTDRVLDALKTSVSVDGSGLDISILDEAFSAFEKRFDDKRGGFGSAPKFPSPHNLMFLLRHWKRTGAERSLHMVRRTLDMMRKGGIYDQVGFGFHRYSTDAYWMLPHFEKMLYDQAMHIMVYTEAYQVSKEPMYRDIVYEIITYLRRELLSPEGGFYSAEDADSEGEEGKFYVWTQDELREILDKNEADAFIETFNIQEGGNYLEEATGLRSGNNIPYLERTLSDIAEALNINEDSLRKRIESAREKLLNARGKRVRPHLDDKILTDWNALMVVALAKAARVFDDREILGLASAALEFIRTTMHDETGMLLHSYRNLKASVPAFLDDYAFMSWALFEMYQATFEVQYLQQALHYSEVMISEFWDTTEGGFYFSGIHSEKILTRQIDAYDGAIPSGNSVAMYNLIRMGRMLGRVDLEERAMKVTERFSTMIRRAPTGFSMMLVGLDFAIEPTSEVIIAGLPDETSTTKMLRYLSTEFFPNTTVMLRGTDEQRSVLSRLAPYTRFHEPIRNSATAYVCIEKNCKLPTTEIKQMIDILTSP